MKTVWLISIFSLFTINGAAQSVVPNKLGPLEGHILKAEGVTCAIRVLYDGEPKFNKLRLYWRNTMNPNEQANPACNYLVEMLPLSGSTFSGYDTKLNAEITFVSSDSNSISFQIGPVVREFKKDDWQLCIKDSKGDICRMDSTLLAGDNKNIYYPTRIQLSTQKAQLIPQGFSEEKNPERVIEANIADLIRVKKGCTNNNVCSQNLVEYSDASQIPEGFKGVDLTWLQVDSIYEDNRVTLIIEKDGRPYSQIEDSSKLRVKPKNK